MTDQPMTYDMILERGYMMPGMTIGLILTTLPVVVISIVFCCCFCRERDEITAKTCPCCSRNQVRPTTPREVELEGGGEEEEEEKEAQAGEVQDLSTNEQETDCRTNCLAVVFWMSFVHVFALLCASFLLLVTGVLVFTPGVAGWMGFGMYLGGEGVICAGLVGACIAVALSSVACGCYKCLNASPGVLKVSLWLLILSIVILANGIIHGAIVMGFGFHTASLSSFG